MDLTIAAYDQAEAQARLTAPYPVIRAFTPTHFQLCGFPTRVTEEIELRRYADIMGENTPRAELVEKASFSQKEAVLIHDMQKGVEFLTRKLFDNPVSPYTSLFGPITLVRAIQYFAELHSRKLMVMDISAGAGYLSAYLSGLGHKLIVTEVTQALYLWQNRLLHHLHLDEWALPSKLTRDDRILHMPWWHFGNLYNIHHSPQFVDIVICDAALGEMDPWAFRYTLHLAKDLLASSTVGCLLYTNVGEQRAQTEKQVLGYAMELGFKVFHLSGVTILCPYRPKLPRSFPPLGGPAALRIPDFLSFDKSKLMESYEFCDYINVGR